MKSCGLSNNSAVTKNIFYYFTVSLQEYTKSNTLHRKAKTKWENFANKLLKSPDLIELYYSAFVVLYYSQDKLDLFW